MIVGASILDDVNPEQRAAIEIIDGPLLVVAGAGSGKTRVITRRIANLIAHGIRGSRILGVTFTNKAAREMHDRVVALVSGSGAPARGDTPLLATFHSLAARILRVDAPRIGRKADFTIYDRGESIEVMKRAAEQAGLPDDFASPHAILEYVSAQRNQRPGTELSWSGHIWRTFEEDLARTRTRYEAILEESNALDFDDLLIQAVRALEASSEALDGWRRRFTHVLVDEFQDTNWHQYRIAKLLTEKNRNLCVTGDPDQSIYTWRGADPHNFDDFRADYPEARAIVLSQNYRSTGAILRCASNVMEPAQNRVHKVLWSELGEGEPVLVVRYASDREEASDIAERVASWRREGEFPLREIAIMFRTNALTLPFERELLARGLPYRVVGGPSFFGRTEVKDLVAYLRVLANPLDTLALLRVINVPARGIGDKTRAILVESAERARVPLSELIARRNWTGVPRKSAESLDRFADLLAELRDVPHCPVSRVVETILAATGYAAWWEERAAANPAVDPGRNLAQLVSFAQDFDHDRQGTLQEFLEQSALLTDQDRGTQDGDRVTLLTIHASKGLEFGAVVVVGVEDDLIPHETTAETPGGIDEERRLLHVAMTRAKRRLILTHALGRTRFGRDRSSAPSRFLRDLGTEGITWSAAGSIEGRGGPPGPEVELELDDDHPLLRLRPGTLVRHPEYGLGKVRHVRGQRRGLDAIVQVSFEDGRERGFQIRTSGISVVEDAEPDLDW